MENCQSSDVVLIFVPMLCIRTVMKFTWVRKWEGRDWGSFWCKYWSSLDTGTLFRSSFVNSSKEKYFASLAWDANRWQWDSWLLCPLDIPFWESLFPLQGSCTHAIIALSQFHTKKWTGNGIACSTLLADSVWSALPSPPPNPGFEGEHCVFLF